MTKPNAATAAPSKRARAEVTVICDPDNKRISNARVEILGKAGPGNTGNDGTWRSPVFMEGISDLKVFAKGFCPPGTNPRKDFEYVNPEEFPPIQNNIPKPFSVHLVRSEPRIKVTVVDPSRGHTIVPGVRLGITQIGGNYTEVIPGVSSENYTALPMGRYSIGAFKRGYGPRGSPTEAADNVEVDLNIVRDNIITMNLQSIWGRVRSNNIQVGGEHFVDWFNKWAPRVPKYQDKKVTFLHLLVKSGFQNIFANCTGLWANELTLEEFIAIFLYIYNETNGEFRSKSEVCQIPNIDKLKYFFESKKGIKASYNGGRNRLAGDQLLKMNPPMITEQDKNKWNDKVWPDPSPDSPLYNAAAECDFYKYRGRGLGQLTWFRSYPQNIDVYLMNEKKKTCEQMSEKLLGDAILEPRIYYGMFKSFLLSLRPQFQRGNLEDWYSFGKALNGDDYGKFFEWRAKQLFDAMHHDGIVLS